MAAQWTDDNPGSVDLSKMVTASGNLTDAVVAYWDAKSAVSTVTGTVAGWTGEAGDAWRTASSTLQTDMLDHRQALIDARTAIGTYRTTVEDIHTRAETQRTKIADAYRVLNQDAPRVSSGASDAEYQEAMDDYRQWQSTQSNAQYDLQDAQGMLSYIAGERTDADSALVAALAAVLPPNWSDTLASLAGVGITDVNDLTSFTNNRDAMVDLANRIGDGDGSEADLAAFGYLLGMYENNELQMSQFFQELGGDGTVQLVDAIGDEYGTTNNAELAASLLLLAAGVRSGLSLGSQNWDATTATEFADSMLGVDPYDIDLDLNAAIAYLYNDPDGSPIGPELTYRLAVGIDEMERMGENPLRSSNPRADYAANALLIDDDPAAFEAAIERMNMNYEPGLFDGAGAVFETLGLYPEQSFAFIGSDGAADARITYWFGERDWAVDGFEGVSSLWMGASQVDGGVTSITGYDSEKGRDEAAMSIAVLNALGSNDSLTASSLSADGALFLGSAINIHLDGISQGLVGLEFVDDDAEWGTPMRYTDPLTGEVKFAPYVHPDLISKVMGAVAGNPAGALVIQAGADASNLRVMGATDGDPAAMSAAVDRVAALQGFIEGTGVGTTLREAAADDAQWRSIIDSITGGASDAVSIGVGFVSLPGGPVAAGVIGGGVGLITDAVAGAGADAWFSSVERYPEANADAIAARAEGQDAIDAHVANVIWESLGLSIGVPMPTDIAYVGDPDAWVDDVMAFARERGVDVGSFRDTYLDELDAGRLRAQEDL
jgi:hypothetical protein